MNLPQIIFLILLVLILLTTLVIVAGLVYKQYKKGAFFCFLPLNHTALVEIFGKPVRWLMHEEDRKSTEETITKMVSDGIITADESQNILMKIVVRHRLLSGLLVKLFNLHITSFNPFAKIKPVKVIKTGVKDVFNPESKLAEHMKPADEKEEKFLRLAWPRSVYVPEIELLNQFQINLITTATKLRVWNLPQIYYQFAGKVSEMTDKAIAAMFIQHLGTKALDKFQVEDMTAKLGPRSLRNKLQGKGLEAIGIYLEGGIEVSDWEPGKDQQAVKDAKLALVAAQARKDVQVKEAEGKAESIILVAKAEAEEIRLKGESGAQVIDYQGTARAAASKKLVEAHNGNEKAAATVSVAVAISGPESKIRAIGTNIMANLED